MYFKDWHNFSVTFSFHLFTFNRRIFTDFLCGFWTSIGQDCYCKGYPMLSEEDVSRGKTTFKSHILCPLPVFLIVFFSIFLKSALEFYSFHVLMGIYPLQSGFRKFSKAGRPFFNPSVEHFKTHHKSRMTVLWPSSM